MKVNLNSIYKIEQIFMAECIYIEELGNALVFHLEDKKNDNVMQIKIEYEDFLKIKDLTVEETKELLIG